MESDAWCPRLTAAMILSGSAVQVKGLGSRLVSATKRLIVAWRSTTHRKTPRFGRRFASLAKKPSTALSHEQEVGVKWKVKRGCRSSPLPHFRMLVGGGMGRRIDIKPDHVAQLVDELRVVGELELLDPVWLETMRVPDALNGTRSNADGFRHHRGSPVGKLRFACARLARDQCGGNPASDSNVRFDPLGY
jgi:hypothetical protein